MKNTAASQFRVEFKGTTIFCANQTKHKIEADIVIGYRSRMGQSGAEKQLYASLKAKKDITLSSLILACGGTDDVIPDFLNDGLAFRSFVVTYGSGEKSSEFQIEFETKITINDTLFDTTIAFNYKTNQGEKSFTFGGILKVNQTHQFDLRFTSGPDAKYLFAKYRYQGEHELALKEIGAAVFGNKAAAVMPDVTLKLKEFTAFLLYKKPEKGKAALVFGMGAKLGLDLKDMPLAGPVLAKEGTFSFENLLVMYAENSFTEADLKNFKELPQVTISAGFNISTSLLINGVSSTYMLNGSTDGDKEDVKPVVPDKPVPAVVESIDGEISSKAKWTKIDKQLGPVNLQRLGFLYQDGKVVILLDAKLAAAGMGMQLMGLGMGFRLEWPPKTPEFYIDGLGLSYTKDPIRISGMFTKVAPKPNIEVYSYYGAAQLSFSKFNISGIGAYSKLKATGDISFFIYAMYQGTIGGPAFFFVTGIAAGFGYNRMVRIPDITEVAAFPLVAMALNPVPAKSLDQILAELIRKDSIPTSPGDYWLAIGIKFSSFKIIESFVLLIVQFGTRTQFTVLGLSILAWPDRDNPIAYVELALKASFGPDSDVISIEAMLTPNSFILDKNCKLTGGFAFYAWVSGEHEGDFVITLGGYHPLFKKPAHYPDVQRLGLNWRISSDLQIKGGLYYALTPSCIMAGGRLEITYSLSFLKASITVWADMLIQWAPFRYVISIGITVHIEANIDMGLFSVNFNLEMSAQLHIWGPPFAGRVFVDWSIFSFTIPFGSSEDAANKKLNWKEFKKQFLPGKATQLPAAANGETTVLAAEIMITDGIINEYEIGGTKYVLVNPHQLKVKIEAPTPVITLKLNEKEVAQSTQLLVNDKIANYKDRNTTLGILPMGTAKLESTLRIAVSGGGGFYHSTYANSVPEALWSPVEISGSKSAPAESRVLPKALKGMILSPEEVPIPEGTPQLDLNGKFNPVENTLTWEYLPAYTGPYNAAYGDHIRDEITNKLKNKQISGDSGIRQKLIDAALIAQGNSCENAVSDGIVDWVTGLSADPVIVQVGGVPQYSPEAGKGIIKNKKTDDHG